MRKLLIWLLAILPALASAVPFETFIDRKNATNSAINPIVIAPPASDAVYFFDKSTNYPKLALLGAGLTITSGVINVDATPADIGAADESHSHAISDVSGLTDELLDRVLTTDPRLSDSRAPTAHTHGFSDLIGVEPARTTGSPNARSISLETAYQCTDADRHCFVTITLSCPSGTCDGEFRIGAANTVDSGGGTNIAPISLSNADYETKTVKVPIGWYFAVRQTTGSGMSIVAAFDQSD
jgi:hypothetical protein